MYSSRKWISSLIALGSLLVVSTGTLLAQDLKITGSAATGIGQVTLNEESSIDAVGEAAINFAATKGAFSAQVELGVADDPGQALDTAEHEMVWAISDAMSLTLTGYGFGIASVGGNISVINAPGGQVGDMEANLDVSDLGLANFEYKMGDLTVGLGLVDACVPACGYGVDGDGNEITGDTAAQTMVVHARGSAGAMGYNAYVTSASATVGGADSATGSGLGVGVTFDGGSFTAALDYMSSTVGCITGLGCSDDVVFTAMGVAVTAAGAGLHYYSDSVAAGSVTGDAVTNIDLVYTFPVGDATVGPEYRMVTTTPPEGDATTDSFVVFGMSIGF